MKAEQETRDQYLFYRLNAHNLLIMYWGAGYLGRASLEFAYVCVCVIVSFFMLPKLLFTDFPCSGLTNGQLKMHLGLVTPRDASGRLCARIRVANETREWVEGRTLFFDDRYV